MSRFNMTISTFSVLPGAAEERESTAFGASLPADISADGKSLLLTEFNIASGKDYGVYLQKTDGSSAVKLGEGFACSLSPDGKWAVALLSSEADLVLLPTGPGESRKIRHDRIAFNRPALWFPDGRRLLVYGIEQGHAARMYIVPIDGGQPQPLTPEGVAAPAAISPDGSRIAAGTTGDSYALYTSQGQLIGPLAGLRAGEIPIVFSADGNFIFVYEFLQPTATVYRLDLVRGKRQQWKEIRPSDPSGVRLGLSVVITPDGQTYAYGVSRYLMDLYLAEGIK